MTNKYNYDDYQTTNEHLTFAEMQRIQQAIIENAQADDDVFIEIWHDLVSAAVDYTQARDQWYLTDPEAMTVQDRERQDLARTEKHNAVLDNFIILERLFISNGWPSADWTEKLFLQQAVPNRNRDDINAHRKRVGDFANYLAFIYALSSR